MNPKSLTILVWLLTLFFTAKTIAELASGQWFIAAIDTVLTAFYWYWAYTDWRRHKERKRTKRSMLEMSEAVRKMLSEK